MHVFYRQEKKIAAPLALLFLIIILTGLSITIKKIKSTIIQAQKTKSFTVTISNLTNHSASIIWQGFTKETGWAIYGKNKNSLINISFDDRNELDQKNKYLNHHATLKNLEENTNYFFQIVSDKQIVNTGDNTPFFLKTTPKFDLKQNLPPAFGKIINKNGLPVKDGLVILTIDGAYPLSALTKASGEWLIPLYYLIDQKTGQSLSDTGETAVVLTITNDEGQKAQAHTTLKNISFLSKTMTIGQKLEFKEEKTNVLSSSTETMNPPNQIIDIIFPKENAVIPGRRPFFKGIASPQTTINLTIKSINNKPIETFDVATDKDGVWNFSMPYDLTPESYILQVKTLDENGNANIISRQFALAKSGEAILGEATPSATLSQAPSPTMQPTPTIIVKTTSIPTPPVTGVNDLSLPLLGAGFMIIGIGFILIF